MAPQPDLASQFLAYDEGPFIVRLGIAMGLLATLFVVLRLWARTYTQIRHGMDDWIVISALVRVLTQHKLPQLTSHFSCLSMVLSSSALLASNACS